MLVDKQMYFEIHHYLCAEYIKILLPTILIKALRTVLTFLSFKGLTQGYLVKISMVHNKYLAFFILRRQ